MIPVIIGVAQLNDNKTGVHPGRDTVELMAAALADADRDGGGGWLDRLDFIGIENQLSSTFSAWPDEEPITPYLLEQAQLSPKATLLTKEPSGDGPVFLLNHAANLIASGEAEVAAIVGAEALRTAALRAANQALTAAQTSDRKADRMRDITDKLVRPIARRYGLSTPTDVYPLYESATRARWQQSFADSQGESGTLWAGYSRAAAENPGAWVRDFYEPQAITAVSPKNRMISFPYTKLMVANSAVNQGAAVILTSLEKAREWNVPEDKIVFVGAGAAASEDADFLARAGYDSSPAMTVSIQKTLELNELETADLDLVELYSCFPCIPKMARRVLGWPLDKLPSVYGGLTFGGGPMGNCMMHAIVVMTRKLRSGGSNGLIYANGGFATHSHSIVLTRNQPHENVFPQNFDYQSTADQLRGVVPFFDEAYIGEGRIEAYSVPYGRDGQPNFGTVIGVSPEGTRFICRIPGHDGRGIRLLVSGEKEAVGTRGKVVSGDDGYAYWMTELQ